ncbi:MAG TPA: methyltransferase [Candidatus Tectomicrobia bacterium]|nr:methyltransferase [Candidatus Tectomicrobia bacterium]
MWEWRAGEAEENTIFNRAKEAESRLTAHALLAAYDFGQFRTVADLGGGNGAFLAALLAHYPGVRGLLFDQPHVVAGAGGAQHTREVWAALFAAGGFHLGSLTPSTHGPCVLEGVPVEAWNPDKG